MRGRQCSSICVRWWPEAIVEWAWLTESPPSSGHLGGDVLQGEFPDQAVYTSDGTAPCSWSPAGGLRYGDGPLPLQHCRLHITLVGTHSACVVASPSQAAHPREELTSQVRQWLGSDGKCSTDSKDQRESWMLAATVRGECSGALPGSGGIVLESHEVRHEARCHCICR